MSRGTGVSSQIKFIRFSEWDILIILDACRYDYFERTVYKYLKGHLRKVIGPDSHTLPWAKKTFGDNREIPEINQEFYW
jgi:hypothetical protein